MVVKYGLLQDAYNRTMIKDVRKQNMEKDMRLDKGHEDRSVAYEVQPRTDERIIIIVTINGFIKDTVARKCCHEA